METVSFSSLHYSVAKKYFNKNTLTLHVTWIKVINNGIFLIVPHRRPWSYFWQLSTNKWQGLHNSINLQYHCRIWSGWNAPVWNPISAIIPSVIAQFEQTLPSGWIFFGSKCYPVATILFVTSQIGSADPPLDETMISWVSYVCNFFVFMT